jgi:phenylacetate-CoA ligase
MVSYAYRWVPYYRDTMDRLRLHPADFRAAADLERLPLLRREDLQQGLRRFVSTERPMASYYALRSSGSTGRPCTFYHDWPSLFGDIGHSARARAALATALGSGRPQRKAWIFPPSGAVWDLQRFFAQHMISLSRVRGVRQQLSVLDPLEANSRRLKEFRPEVIFAHGSYLALLFAHWHATGDPVASVRAVQYTSDAIPDTARALIESQMGVAVFSIYEAAEAHSLAFECEQHAGLHVNADLYPLRVVDKDGRTLPLGKPGDVVVSNLVNRGTVLLNFLVGDVAALLPHSCACGRSLPLMSHVQGRSDDWLELPNGELVHPHLVLGVFKFDSGVWQYQMVQESSLKYSVYIVAGSELDRDQTTRRLQSELARILGQNAQVRVCYVDEIARTAAGKVRPIVSLVKRRSPS